MVGGAIGIGTKGDKFAMILAGGLTGGISAEMAGGNFWAGARQGLITAGLNHVAHAFAEGIEDGLLRAAEARRVLATDPRSYEFGSPMENSTTWDCSKFCKIVAATFGIELPRYSLDQQKYFQDNGIYGNTIDGAQVGDFIYWEINAAEGKYHTGIIVDQKPDGRFVVVPPRWAIVFASDYYCQKAPLGDSMYNPAGR